MRGRAPSTEHATASPGLRSRGESMSRTSRERLLLALCGVDPVARVEAAKRVAGDSSMFVELRDLLGAESRPEVRHAIAYALSWQKDARVWPILVRLLSDPSEAPTVRGQAAEGIAYHLHRRRRRSAPYRRAMAALVRALNDAAPEVRYYCAFALGESGDRRALRHLAARRRDRARSPAFTGTVGDEVGAALQRIRASRKRRTTRC